jgi:hypothetical protein
MIWVVSSNILWRSLALFMNDKWTVHRSMGSAIKWDQAPCLRDAGREAQTFPHFDDLVCVFLKVPWKEIDRSCLSALAFFLLELRLLALSLLPNLLPLSNLKWDIYSQGSWNWNWQSLWRLCACALKDSQSIMLRGCSVVLKQVLNISV